METVPRFKVSSERMVAQGIKTDSQSERLIHVSMRPPYGMGDVFFFPKGITPLYFSYHLQQSTVWCDHLICDL